MRFRKEREPSKEEQVRSPEKLGQEITSITVVVPSLDETTNILTVSDTLHRQRRTLSPNIPLRLIISDNGSTTDTLSTYDQIITEETLQREEDKIDITIVHGSKKGFNG